MIPHPDKAYKMGEDAYYISENGRVLAIADGVGGWAELNVDPSLFSRGLMKAVGVEVENSSSPHNPPKDLLGKAYRQILGLNIEGSCTACVLTISEDRQHVSAANLGDSGFIVIRKDKIIFRSKEQQHSFNYPYQLGSNGRGMAERPDQADSIELDVEMGDFVVMGTDGLFDNLFDQDIVDILMKPDFSKVTKEDAGVSEKFASLIAQRAYASATSTAPTPFSVAARKSKFKWSGGKLDDITVLVAQL